MNFLANAIPISTSHGSISVNVAEQKVEESSEIDSESVLRRMSFVNATTDLSILDDRNATTITLEDLRRLAHAPIDPLEEECLDRVRQFQASFVRLLLFHF